ncbi:MAG: hypothetical protein ACE5OZ_10665 [Candidatus Heimdallarchaeota archaeon]
MGKDKQLTLDAIYSKGKKKIGLYEICSKSRTPQWVKKEIAKNNLLKGGEDLRATVSCEGFSLKLIALILSDRFIFWDSQTGGYTYFFEDISRIETVKTGFLQEDLVIYDRHSEGRWPFGDKKLAAFLEHVCKKSIEEKKRAVRRAEPQNLRILRETLSEVLFGADVSLSTIQNRIFERRIDEAETERLLLLLQDEGTLPGRYDRITQTFRREEERKPLSMEESKAELRISSPEPTCRFCGELLSEGDEICPDCGQKASFCSICRKSVSFGEAASLCPYCFTVYHEKHLLETIKVQGKCPMCKAEVAEGEMIRQELGNKKN